MAEASGRRARPPESGPLPRAKGLAAVLPDLLIQAQRLSATVVAGWHGRRRSGPGEQFWQFRPFAPGEPVNRIDWRRSARDEHLYVREREWEAAHTLWLSADLSVSMDYRSDLAPVPKRDRAVVLLLALADLAARGGERVGLLGLSRPVAARDVAERLAESLAVAPPEPALPATGEVRRFADVVRVGDFLDPVDDLVQWVERLAGQGVRGHLVQILDPTEETFPFAGRIEFVEPESGARILAGRADSWGEIYRARLAERRDVLDRLARRAGWNFLVHHTDRSAAEPLIALSARLGAAGGPR